MASAYQEPAIWEKLQELDHFRMSRPGQAKASCPAHDDRNPSLSIGTKDDGRVVFHCHAGCAPDDVLAALGATWRDCWPNGASGVEKRYEVKDRKGVTKATHRRVYNQETGEKTMPWVKGTSTPTLPLYGTEKLAGLPPDSRVYLTEGESDCEALCKRGLVAVATVTGASGDPCDDSLLVLRKFDVALWPDNDDAGCAHMERTAQRLMAMGSDCSLVEWTDAPPKGGADDYFAHGGAVEGLDALLRRLSVPTK
jgi:putative DNA primase/helicase